jgi:ATP-dependent helicase HrpA
LRRLCTPAAEYATAIAASARPEDGELLDAICNRFRSMLGIELKPADFAPERLEAHLLPRLLLEDADGKLLDQAASLAELRQRHAGAARAALNRSSAGSPWCRDGITDWDFGTLPEQVLVEGIHAYPALCSRQDGIALRLYETAEAAAAAHAAGVLALLLARLGDRLRDLSKTARGGLGLALAQTGLGAEALALQAAERAAHTCWKPAGIRDEASFRAALERRSEFGRDAARLLEDICGWLGAAMEIRKRLDTQAKPWPEAATDLRSQLADLFAPGFVAQIPEEVWPRVAVYLKAAALRLDRLPHKPQRDLELTRQVKAEAQRLPGPFHPARWLIEEWRIALFAQELRASGAPSAAKVQAALNG